MDSLFPKDTGIFLRDKDNAMWDIHKGDFPITLYDRPSLALSNLVLRGDVDAATRAIFSPQTLTPAELKTFKDEVLKGKENPLLKTVVDIATNPLVIIGALMVLKYPISGGTHTIFKIGEGLMNSPPGPIASKLSGAFVNLRNVPNAFRILARWARTTGDVIYDWGESFNKAVTTVKRLDKDSWMKISAKLQGFDKVPVKDEVLTGSRLALHKAHGLAMDRAIWPGLNNIMSKEEKMIAKNIRGWANNFMGMITKDTKRFKEFKRTMAMKGQGGMGGPKVAIGDWIQNYFPIYGRYSQLEGQAVYDMLRTEKNYHIGLQKIGSRVSGHLRERMGVSVGQLAQLRRMEQLGMPPIVDDLMKSVRADTARMEGFLKTAWDTVKGISKPSVRAEQFSDIVISKMQSARMNLRARLGHSAVAKRALANVSSQLAANAPYPGRFNSTVKNLAAVITEPAQYDMRPVQAFRRYLTTAASSYTWHIAKAVHPKTGKAVTGFRRLIEGPGGILPALKADPTSAPWQYSYLTDHLLPLMQGLKPFSAYKRAATMGTYKAQVLKWLNTHPLPKKMLTPGSQEYLKRYFGSYGSLSSESLGAKISEFFYVSTLGLNISPASKNLLQNYITLLHTPGISAVGLKEGMVKMAEGIKVYKDGLVAGMGREAAFNKAFPDYIKAVGKSSGMTGAMIRGDIMLEGKATPAALHTMWEKAKTGMLMPFSTSESFNRLFGFYVGRASHLAAGATPEAANEFGAMINHIAHFPGGPLGMPRALLGVWGPLRQFMHFPLRYAGFLAATPSMTGMGGLGQFRPLATAAGASAAAYLAGKNLLGVDLSQGLLTGALPVPIYEKAPFHPWPLVPPMVGIAGSVAKGIHAGEGGEALRSLALLAPGGIALRRLYKTLGPKYADYDNRLADGRIPIYNDQKSLIGAYSPWQLTLKSLGLSPSTQQAEYGAAKWLLSQREKIRQYRRQYLEALVQNDTGEADKINREFQRSYPELGPLQLKKSDITAVKNRYEVSRLHRILKGFPKSYQPLFSHVVSQAGLSEMTRDIQANPNALETYLPLTTGLR